MANTRVWIEASRLGKLQVKFTEVHVARSLLVI